MLLEVDDLCVNYGRIEAIRDISFTVEEGEIVTLIGANGAGKTTTLKTISGLRPVRAGTVVLRRPGHHRRCRRTSGPVLGISQSPEGRGCFPGMTVSENLDMGAYARAGPQDQQGHRATATGCSTCSPGCKERTHPGRRARCPAASSRCWPSAAR